MSGASHATKQEIDAFFKVAKSPKANQVSNACARMTRDCTLTDGPSDYLDMLRLPSQGEISCSAHSLEPHQSEQSSPLSWIPDDMTDSCIVESDMEQCHLWRVYLPGLFQCPSKHGCAHYLCAVSRDVVRLARLSSISQAT